MVLEISARRSHGLKSVRYSEGKGWVAGCFCGYNSPWRPHRDLPPGDAAIPDVHSHKRIVEEDGYEDWDYFIDWTTQDLIPTRFIPLTLYRSMKINGLRFRL